MTITTKDAEGWTLMIELSETEMDNILSGASIELTQGARRKLKNKVRAVRAELPDRENRDKTGQGESENAEGARR